MDGQVRHHVKHGIEVGIVLKQSQRLGTITKGTVKDILTKSTRHPME